MLRERGKSLEGTFGEALRFVRKKMLGAGKRFRGKDCKRGGEKYNKEKNREKGSEARNLRHQLGDVRRSSFQRRISHPREKGKVQRKKEKRERRIR